MHILTAPVLVVSADTLLPGGGVVVRGGRIDRVLASRSEAVRLARRESMPWTDLDEGLIAPALVNAHAHLELSFLAGRVSAEGGFRGWVENLMAARSGADPAEIPVALAGAADRLLAGGTGAVGDIDSSGAVHSLVDHPLRIVAFREALDAGDASRLPAVLQRLDVPMPTRVGLREGLSPHAPFTVSMELGEELAKLASRRHLPIAVHWAETEEEEDFLRTGQGAFEGFVSMAPELLGLSGLDRLERAGLVGTRTALVHGNWPGKGEVERVATAGATVVHCPGSHAFFDRAPFPIERYLAAGVPIALGTDSAASNRDLDMRREMRLLRESSDVAPREVLRMATEHGARALGVHGELGRLEAGYRADLCAFGTGKFRGEEEALEELTDGSPEVQGVWLGGRRVYVKP